MNNYIIFVINSIMLGIGLAMDAFSVCVANGLSEGNIQRRRKYKLATVFGMFQMIMPIIGWCCVKTISEYFKGFQIFIPWIALILLSYIGGKMIYEELKRKKEMASEKPDTEEEKGITSDRQLIIQGIATSIDALSVGFTIADQKMPAAFISAVIIGAVTFMICMVGLKIGEKAGEHLSKKATIVGGIILIGIGFEIFISHMI